MKARDYARSLLAAKANDRAAENVQRSLYADAGPEMERLLMIARAEFAFEVGEQIDAVLKAVQPKKEKR